MKSYPAMRLAVVAAVVFTTGQLCGQETSDAKPAPPSATTAPGKDSGQQTIGFATDGQISDVQIESLPDDAFFDRYLTLQDLAEAWKTMQSDKLADLAIRAAEGERVLLRGRHGLPTAFLWEVAQRTAEVQGNDASLKRLTAAAEQSGMKDILARLQASTALAGDSRAASEATTINPLEVTTEDFAILKEYSRSIEGAAVRGDVRYLQDVKKSLGTLFPQTPALRKILESLLQRSLSRPSATPLEPKLVGAMDQLQGDSRGFGFKFPSAPSLPSLPDPGKALREAAERARAAADAEARRAADALRERAEAARRAAAAEAARAADLARERAAAAKKAAEVEAARAVEAAKQAGRDIDRERLNAIEQIRRYWLPLVGQYIAFLDSQASNRYRGLPQRLQGILAPHYPGVDLGRVRYAESIDTVHGQGITIGNNIYFTTNVDVVNQRSDLHWLLHELEHVGQYRAMGGIEPFLTKYVFNGAIQIGARGSFSIHDNINIERDAENKANRIIAEIWAASRAAAGGGAFPLVASDPLAGTWTTDGRTASFSNGVCTIQTVNGTASFRYSYDQQAGTLVGLDGNGVRTETRINWLSQNSIEWVSPGGRRHYVRSQ